MAALACIDKKGRFTNIKCKIIPNKKPFYDLSFFFVAIFVNYTYNKDD
jgi:hypothetical protein